MLARMPLIALLPLLLFGAPASAEAPPPAAPTAASASGSPLEGVWRNTRDTIHLRASRCGAAVCGTVIAAAARHQVDAQKGSGRGLVGMQLFSSFRPAGASTWTGKIYIPDINKNANGKIVLTDRDSITVSGCLVFGLACKTQHWHRIG
jgi:uncharacterized protein (DUF2147 family)